MAQLMPLLLTVSCFNKIQIGFTFLVPAYLGSPGQRAVKRVCVCYINHNQILYSMTFRSLSEIFVRRSCSILLLALATVVMWRGKKSVVHVAQCIAAVVLFIERRPSFRVCTASLIPLIPLSDSLSRIVDYDQLITLLTWLAWSSQSWFILFWQTRLCQKKTRHLNSCP